MSFVVSPNFLHSLYSKGRGCPFTRFPAHWASKLVSHRAQYLHTTLHFVCAAYFGLRHKIASQNPCCACSTFLYGDLQSYLLLKRTKTNSWFTYFGLDVVDLRPPFHNPTFVSVCFFQHKYHT